MGHLGWVLAQPNPEESVSGKPSQTNQKLSRVFASLRDGVLAEKTGVHRRDVDRRLVGP
ncbi:hypothetical protein CsSME_00006410 [Camellia sinensis var. sinensis]